MTFYVHEPYLQNSFIPLMLDNHPSLTKHKHIHIVAEHIMYNKKEFQYTMPKDTVYISSLREPVSHFKSIVNFFKVKFYW